MREGRGPSKLASVFHKPQRFEKIVVVQNGSGRRGNRGGYVSRVE